MTTFWQALHSLFQDIFAQRACILLSTGSRCSVMCRNMYCTILKSKMTTCLCFSTWNTHYGRQHSRSQPLRPPDPNLFRYCTHLAPRIESTLCFISFVFGSLIWESFFLSWRVLGACIWILYGISTWNEIPNKAYSHSYPIGRFLHNFFAFLCYIREFLATSIKLAV